MNKNTETDLTLMEGAAREWRFALKNASGDTLPPADFVIYGSAACMGEAPRAFAVAVEGEQVTARMPGLPLADSLWCYQLFAQERSSKVEWLLASGNVNLIPRCAGAGVKLDPVQANGSFVLDAEATQATFVLGDNLASVQENRRRAEAAATAAGNQATAATQAATQAASSATAAGNQATAATQAATQAANSATAAGNQATAATQAATQAANSATAAGNQATAATQAATQAASSATAAGNQATAATSAASAASSAATNAANAAAASVGAANAAAASASAAIDAANAAGADQAALAAEKAHEAAEHAADARRRKQEIEQREAAYAEHMDNTVRHLTTAEHNHLTRLIRDFPEVNPDSPDTPDLPTDPGVPDTALSHAFMRDFFAKHAQPGAAQAPPAVYVSRVPWARKNENGAWVNNAPAVDEAVFGATRKFMDNAGLQHACSTDTVENVDDYNGKLWPFFWARGNYVTDEHGVKHVSAIEGQVINGVSFDAQKPTCAFGPSFYFFCKLEMWQNPESGQWTTHDGTAEGVPLYQLYGISARPWDDLDASRRTELEKHGVTAADFHLWAECVQWDSVEGKPVSRPYWCHSAYCGGADVAQDGAVNLASKRDLPLYNNMSHNTLVAKYGNRAGFGGSAAVNGFGVLFDVVKNATKHSQTIHSGMASNNCNAVKATHSTAQPDYLFPISAQSHFRVGCTVWLWQSANNSTATTYRRSMTVQIGRIKAIETRSLALADGTTAESMCLVIDSTTVQPFVTRTGADDAEAIAATKELTDQGVYACCFATQGMALAGETDAVLGLHDGSCTSNSDSRHPYRVQGTEYMPGIFMTAADTVAFKGNGVIDVEIGGEVIIPLATEYVILQAPLGVTRKTSGNLQNYLEHGYIPIGITPASASGYILNAQLSSTGVLYPVAVAGTGSSDSTGHADYLWVSANPAEFLFGGRLDVGGDAGSASLRLSNGLGYSYWGIGARD